LGDFGCRARFVLQPGFTNQETVNKPTNLLRNSILAFTTNVVIKAVNAVAFILIARLAGAQPAGIFSLGTTYLVIFTATTWGLDELMIRQVARDRSTSAQYFGTFLLLRALLVGMAYLIMVLLVGRLMPYPASTSYPILILGLSIIPDSLGNVGQSLLNAHERFELPLVAGIAGSLIKLAAGAWVAVNGRGLVGIGWAWVIGSCLAAVINLIAAGRLAWPWRPRLWLDWPFWIYNLQLALPFLGMGFLLTVEYQTDVVILSAVQNEVVVGWYGAVTTIIFALNLLAQGYRAAVYPLMARYRQTDPVKLKRLYERSLFYLGALGLPMAAGLALLAPEIIVLIFKPAFSGAIVPLQIMAWLLVFNYLMVPNSRLMLVSDQQKLLMLFLVGSMGTNILLNLWLDPRFGAIGASTARVCSSMLFFLVNDLYVNRALMPHNVIKIMTRPVLATMGMALAVWWTRGTNLWLAILAGVVVYGVLIFILYMPQLKDIREEQG
jgi:PST family polysaccharide transporter